MHLLTNYIGGINGGINRRVYEIGRFVNSTDNHENHKLFAVGMGNDSQLQCEECGNVKTYSLPFQDWHRIKPGSEQKVSKQLESFETFLDFLQPTVNVIADIINNEKIDACLAQAAFFSPWTVLAASKICDVPCIQLYCGSAQTEILNDKIREAYLDIEKRFSEYATRTFFNSQLAKKTVQKKLRRNYADSNVIYNGFPAEYSNLVHNMPDNIVVGWIGRNAEVKQMEYLWKLRPALADEIPIRVLTNIDPEEAGKLSVPGLQIEHRIPPEKMHNFYTKISCVLSTSHFEFFPNVITEAISAGRVPIVPQNSGIVELFQNLNLGELVVDLEDVNAVVELISRSSDFVPAIRNAGMKLRDELSWTKVIQDYFGEFSKVLI